MVQVAIVGQPGRYELGILVDGEPWGVCPYSTAQSIEGVLQEMQASFTGHEVKQVSVTEYNQIKAAYKQKRWGSSR